MGSLLDKKIEIPSIDDFIKTERKAVKSVIDLFNNTINTFKPGKHKTGDDDVLYPNAFSEEIKARQQQEPLSRSEKLIEKIKTANYGYTGLQIGINGFLGSPVHPPSGTNVTIDHNNRLIYDTNTGAIIQGGSGGSGGTGGAYVSGGNGTGGAGGTNEEFKGTIIYHGPGQGIHITSTGIEKFEIPLATPEDFVNIEQPLAMSGTILTLNEKTASPLPPPDAVIIDRANAILNGSFEISPTED